MKLHYLLPLLAILPQGVYAQGTRTIRTINIAAAPIVHVGSLATRRLAEGTDEGGEDKMGVLLFSKDSLVEPKRKYVGNFTTDGNLNEGTLTFKNGDRYDGTFSKNEYYDGEYSSKRGGWTFKGSFRPDFTGASDIEARFTNGDSYKGFAMAMQYHVWGNYRFADGEVIIASWDNNVPQTGALFIPGKDTVHGTFMSAGAKVNFKSATGNITRSYIVEGYDTKQEQLLATKPSTGLSPGNTQPDSVCIRGNCKTGRGKLLYLKDGSYYDGSFVAGQRDGHGIYEDRNSYYSGDWKGGVWNGKGIAIHKRSSGYQRPIDTLTYKAGAFIAGVLNGEGTDYQSDNLYYKGNFRDGKLNGKGLYNAAGMIYEGNFKDGQLSGHGSLFF